MKLLNWKNCKIFTLETASEIRHHKFTRVSKSFETTLTIKLQDTIRNHIQSLPSKGKTIQ